CHVAENVFDQLRNRKIHVTSELMDTVLQALDTVNGMFQDVNNRQEPEPADRGLLADLTALANGQQLAAAEESVIAEEPAAPVVSESAPAEDFFDIDASAPVEKAGGEISDEEFAQFMDALHEPAVDASAVAKPVESAAPASAGGSEEITEDEFEALLDKLHGKGKHGGSPASAAPAPVAPASAVTGESDEISEDEFEALLDQLHGKGKHGGSPQTAPVAPAKPLETVAAAAGDAELITDDEFESLLDQLHGKGKGPTTGQDAVKPAAKPAAAPVETVKPSAPAAQVIKPAAKSVEAPKPAAAPAPRAEAVKPEAKVEKTRPAKGDDDGEGVAGAETTVRVDTKRLDDIMNMVGELVLVRNRLVRLGLKSADEAMSKAVANLDVVTGDLQTAVMKTRMQPIKKVFGRFPRVVRDLARNLKKEINLELEGEETDLDKNLVEALADPLVHLVRNAVDHGIEKPDDRANVGKPRAGRVVLAAQQEGDHIVLSISDDGGGMDPALLRRKAVEKGLMDHEAAERLSESEAFNLIFHPGFSTKEQISDVSGRGVGMDVVKTKISQLNGTIDVQSQKGVGTRIAIKVPLTLAIMPTLMVMLAKQAFALPLVSVNEIFHMDLSKTNVVDGQEVVVVREKALPLFYLKRWLVEGEQDTQQQYGHVVIVTVGTQKVGFVVDQLIGQEEVVIKPLGKMLHGTPGMAGATITGDGRIALILDVPSMLKRYAGRL
ncbi:MAG TPA: chemotaxis protein CheA, partial [Pseudomonadales bacterium]|nr:chemotaxis protein CheA [Pseudomonadales bacterium]